MEYIHKQLDECPDCGNETETEHYFDFTKSGDKEYSEKIIQCDNCGCSIVSAAEATASVDLITFQASKT